MNHERFTGLLIDDVFGDENVIVQSPAKSGHLRNADATLLDDIALHSLKTFGVGIIPLDKAANDGRQMGRGVIGQGRAKIVRGRHESP